MCNLKMFALFFSPGTWGTKQHKDNRKGQGHMDLRFNTFCGIKKIANEMQEGKCIYI